MQKFTLRNCRRDWRPPHPPCHLSPRPHSSRLRSWPCNRWQYIIPAVRSAPLPNEHVQRRRHRPRRFSVTGSVFFAALRSSCACRPHPWTPRLSFMVVAGVIRWEHAWQNCSPTITTTTISHRDKNSISLRSSNSSSIFFVFVFVSGGDSHMTNQVPYSLRPIGTVFFLLLDFIFGRLSYSKILCK